MVFSCIPGMGWAGELDFRSSVCVGFFILMMTYDLDTRYLGEWMAGYYRDGQTTWPGVLGRYGEMDRSFFFSVSVLVEQRGGGGWSKTWGGETWGKWVTVWGVSEEEKKMN